MYTVVGVSESRAFRVLWALEELDIPYEHRPSRPPTLDSRARDRANKAPVMIEDGETLTDPIAIVQYLADKHGGLTHPAGTLARLRQDSLTHLILEELEGPLWDAARHSVILPQILRSPSVFESLLWEYSRALQRISEKISPKAWLAGDRFTVPDIMLVHCILWASLADFPKPPASLAAYLLRVKGRDAFRRLIAKGSAQVGDDMSVM
ncbi:MAG TPA: glutathione S-transferase [Rhodobacteraceae bacterium]|nr:glutathione S-transferase family protein [Paracoccaceae bacterium]HBG97302.1 glutathione S-transferase [Paracoccaceae bacterium]